MKSESKYLETFRDEENAAIAVNVFLRQTTAGVFYDSVPSRAYAKSEEETGYANSYGDREIDAVIRCFERAKSYIAQKKANAATCRGSQDDQSELFVEDVAA